MRGFFISKNSKEKNKDRIKNFLLYLYYYNLFCLVKFYNLILELDFPKTIKTYKVNFKLHLLKCLLVQKFLHFSRLRLHFFLYQINYVKQLLIYFYKSFYMLISGYH